MPSAAPEPREGARRRRDAEDSAGRQRPHGTPDDEARRGRGRIDDFPDQLPHRRPFVTEEIIDFGENERRNDDRRSLAEAGQAVHDARQPLQFIQLARGPFVLGSYLENIKGTVFRQTQFAEFELRMHEMAQKGQPITGDSLAKLYLDITKRYYGHDQKICVVLRDVQRDHLVLIAREHRREAKHVGRQGSDSGTSYFGGALRQSGNLGRDYARGRRFPAAYKVAALIVRDITDAGTHADAPFCASTTARAAACPIAKYRKAVR